jgi:cell division initiation protein
LKTAEDTGANLIDQANKAAELHLKETEMNAQAVMSESKSKSKAIIEQAEQQAKELISEMQDAIKDLEKNYQTIENQRDTLVTELQNIAEDITDRIKRTNKQHKEFKVEDHLIKVKQMVRESEDQINKEQLTVVVPRSKGIPTTNSNSTEGSAELAKFISSKQDEKEAKPKEKEKKEEVKADEGSFFDQIDN